MEPKTLIDTLDAYATAFRELINNKVWERDERPHSLLRLTKEDDWSFVCVAMDIVEDASLAIKDFLRFGLNGPTKYDSVGERYLRLYGVLSASYIQQEATRKLFALMNCPSPKELKACFDALEIRKLRHQLASHGVDFLDHNAKATRAFVPVRIELDGYTCSVAENRGDVISKYRLDLGLGEHIGLIVSVLDAVFEKSFRTLYKGRGKRIAEYEQTLSDLRFVRDGNLLIETGTAEHTTKIRVELVSTTK